MEGMKICVIGAGMQGRIVAQDLVNSGHKVTIIDNNISYLRQLKRYLKIDAQQFDVTYKVKFIKFLKNFDVVVGALPAALGYYTMDCAIKAGVDLVDMSYSVEDPLLLDEKAKLEQIRIIPDAGFAPGLSNILVGETYSDLGGIESLKIRAGGIPQKPEPPFNYRVTWSHDDLIEEYTRPARIVRNCEVRTVDALSGVEKLTVPEVGRLECFYTDGLRTLLKTIRDAKTMEEKTIRYPGYAKIFKIIIDCGFLSNQSVSCGKRLVKVKNVTTEFLRNVLSAGDERDISILIIEIKKGSKKRRHVCIDYYDDKSGITSMARMTGYTCSIIVQCIKKYPHYGVIPPEYLGMDKELSRFIRDELEKRNINIKSK